MAGRWSARIALGLMLPALHACTFDNSALGSEWLDAGSVDAGPADVRPGDRASDDSRPADGADAPLDAESGDASLPADAAPDAKPDAAVDAAYAEGGPPPCAGAPVGGYCWYASAPDQSCSAACATHGGCNLAGTRDFAGSGGSDANCLSVLTALGFGGYRHQNWSNNDLGCHFAWPTDPWTYWSTAYTSTCEAAYPGMAHAQRMCACNQ